MHRFANVYVPAGWPLVCFTVAAVATVDGAIAAVKWLHSFWQGQLEQSARSAKGEYAGLLV